MLTGRQTLASIEQALRQVHDQVEKVDEQVQATSNALVELQREQAGRYKKLAEIRLDHMVSGQLAESLDAASRRATELLEARVLALKELEKKHQQIRAEGQQLEQNREQASGDVAEAAEAIDGAEAAVQRRLEKDRDYLAQLERARHAERVAAHAEEKTEQAQRDREQKGKPYEDDPLFSYLWERGYGTSSYSANLLTRFLDKWIARLCRYHDARPNYSMLLALPERLREHAENVRAVADSEFESLRALEEEAAAADGVTALHQALQEAEQRLEEIDEGIRQNEQNQNDLLEERTRFAAGEDEHFRDAVETLSEAFARENVEALYRYVEATPTAEDDVIVHELVDARRQSEDLRQDLTEQKRMHVHQLNRLQELEEVRQRFKRARYDSNYSGFKNADLISMILMQFLQGLATQDDLWRTIQREQRHRRIESRPDFGSGGFGRRGGTWRTPFPGGWGGGRGGGLGGGWGGGRGGGGGGGFRTGGGF